MSDLIREKIALLNDSFPPTIDGVATTVLNYATFIQKNHADSMVLTPYYPGVEDHYDFPVIRYRSHDLRKHIYNYRAGDPFSPRLLSRLHKEQPTLIHSHCPAMSNTLARLCMKDLQIPTVFTYHTKFDIDLAKTVKSKFWRDAALKYIVSSISACDEVWVVSQGAGENLKSLGYQGEYRLMENGVDFPQGRASDALIEQISRKWDLPENVPIFLFVGRLLWYKGLRLDMDALAKIKAEGRDFRFVIVGDGVDRPEMEDYAKQLGIDDKCIFVGPIHDREELRGYFSRADLFLFASTYDTNGIVVREAAACSCPSVLLLGSCAAEGVVDRVSGLIVPETIEGMASAMRYACDNRDAVAQIGRNATEQIYLSWEDAVARAYTRYEQILTDFRAGKRSKKPFVLSDEAFAVMGNSLRLLGDAHRKITDSRWLYMTLEKRFQDRLAALTDRSPEKTRSVYAQWNEEWQKGLEDSGYADDYAKIQNKKSDR